MATKRAGGAKGVKKETVKPLITQARADSAAGSVEGGGAVLGGPGATDSGRSDV